MTFLEAGCGLAAAHAEGIVHRDFKPNVLVAEVHVGGKGKLTQLGSRAAWCYDDPGAAAALLRGARIADDLEPLHEGHVARGTGRCDTGSWMSWAHFQLKSYQQ